MDEEYRNYIKQNFNTREFDIFNTFNPFRKNNELRFQRFQRNDLSMFQNGLTKNVNWFKHGRVTG